MVSVSTNAHESLRLPYVLLDHRQETHLIEVGAEAVLLNGQSATITAIAREGIRLQTPEGCFTFAPEQFWRAFASSDPTVEEAALLLADVLARWSAAHHLAQTFSTLLQPVFVPSAHDSFVRRALEAFDGSEEMVLLLARILQQDPAVIIDWARRLGKPIAGSVPPSIASNGHRFPASAVSPASSHESSKERGAAPAFDLEASQNSVIASSRRKTHFTEAQVEQMRQAYATSVCVKDTIAQLAQQFQCSVASIRSKLYTLDLPKKRQIRSHTREAGASEQTAPKEEDRFSESQRRSDGASEGGARTNE